MAGEGSISQSTMSFLSHPSAQILSGRIPSCTLSQVKITLSLLSWRITFPREFLLFLWGHSRSKLSLHLPKVSNAGSRSITKTPENKENHYLAVSIPALRNTSYFYVTPVHFDVVRNSALLFESREVQKFMLKVKLIEA